MMFTNTPGLAVINGVLTPLHDAQIPLTDRGFLFGHAIFETLLVSNGNIIEWDYHFARLQSSCKKALLSCPEEIQLIQNCSFVVNEMQKIKHDSRNIEPIRMSLRIFITGGTDLEPTLALKCPTQIKNNVYIFCQQSSYLTVEQRLKGFALKSFLDQRGSFLIGIKSTNYLFQMLCLEEAKQNGFDDALFVNNEGAFTEGVTSSFLWFDGNYSVFSTPTIDNCLEGTSILKLQRELKNEKRSLSYRSLHKNDTTNCVGCALVSSVRGVVPIKKIDDVSFDIVQHSKFFKYLIECFNA